MMWLWWGSTNLVLVYYNDDKHGLDSFYNSYTNILETLARCDITQESQSHCLKKLEAMFEELQLYHSC